MRIRKIEINGRDKAAAPQELCVLNDPEKRAKRTEKVYKSAETGNSFFKNILSNPNLGFQIMVIILTIASENVQMDRRIAGMTTTVEKIRNITEVIGATMTSVKAASEAPKKIRQMLE